MPCLQNPVIRQQRGGMYCLKKNQNGIFYSPQLCHESRSTFKRYPCFHGVISLHRFRSSPMKRPVLACCRCYCCCQPQSSLWLLVTRLPNTTFTSTSSNKTMHLYPPAFISSNKRTLLFPDKINILPKQWKCLLPASPKYTRHWVQMPQTKQK